MATIDFFKVILLLLVIYLIFKVNRLSKSVSTLTTTAVASKSTTTPKMKMKKPTNKLCPISGLPIDHPGSEISVVDLPNGNKVSVCSNHCKEKIEDLFHKYG